MRPITVVLAFASWQYAPPRSVPTEADMADPDRLTEVEGLGQGVAAFWRLLQECQARRALDCVREKAKFTSPEQVRTMICARLGHLAKEEFWVILVDNQNRLVSFEHVFSGTVDQTAAYPREILELTLRHKASGLILVHNHPSGSATPSRADELLTTTRAVRRRMDFDRPVPLQGVASVIRCKWSFGASGFGG